MTAKDIFHDAVKAALIKDGWTITDDPFTISSKGTERSDIVLGLQPPEMRRSTEYAVG